MKNVLRSPKGGIGERERMRGMLMGKGEVAGDRGVGGRGAGELPRYHLTYEGDRLNIN